VIVDGCDCVVCEASRRAERAPHTSLWRRRRHPSVLAGMLAFAAVVRWNLGVAFDWESRLFDMVCFNVWFAAWLILRTIERANG
jgi:hypothetical protein